MRILFKLALVGTLLLVYLGYPPVAKAERKNGFRVLGNNYAQKVQCMIDNNFKMCKKDQWKAINF